MIAEWRERLADFSHHGKAQQRYLRQVRRELRDAFGKSIRPRLLDAFPDSAGIG